MESPQESPLLPEKGDYDDLVFFQKAECIFDITYYFAHKYLRIGDRTIDQMVQAARSAKQNIAEGCINGTTSVQSEMRLINVARGSLHELLLDYKDYLRVRGLELWSLNSPKGKKTRQICAGHNDSAFYRKQIVMRSDEVICNIAITLIHQSDALMRAYLKTLQEDFLEGGGVRERLFMARLKFRIGQKNNNPTGR